MFKIYFKYLLIVLAVSLIKVANSYKITTESPQSDDDEYPQENPVIIGDMKLTKDQHKFLYGKDNRKRHGLKNELQHWPNGIVPVIIDEKAYDEGFKNVIREAAAHIMNVSCITFQFDAKNATDHLFITEGEGCSTFVGALRDGPQVMTLSKECLKGNIIHEFLHTLGFLHMQTAVDRDDYIDIKFDNIIPEAYINFEKYTNLVSMYGTHYDYGSIMHYPKDAFAIDESKPTIVPHEKAPMMGQRIGMSEGDITRLNHMYECRGFTTKETFEKPGKNSKKGKNVKETKEGNVKTSIEQPNPKSKKTKATKKVSIKESSKKPKSSAKSNPKKPSKALKKLKQHEYRLAGAKATESHVTSLIKQLQVAIRKLIIILLPLKNVQKELESLNGVFNNSD